MTVTIQVPLTQEEQTAILAHANARGVPVDALLRRAVLQIIAPPREIAPQRQLSPEEFERAFEEIADMIPEDVPPIPDEALTRDKTYTREDHW